MTQALFENSKLSRGTKIPEKASDTMVIQVRDIRSIQEKNRAIQMLVGTMALAAFCCMKPSYLNWIRFRTFRSPLQFPNQYTFETPQSFKSVTSKTITNEISEGGTGTFLYVIRPNGTLVMGERGGVFDGFSGWHGYTVHSSLAQGKSVLAAGEFHVRVRNGRPEIEKIDNNSGHYIPFGSHLKGLVERVFKTSGFFNVNGKYQEHQFRSDIKPTERRLQPFRDSFFFTSSVVENLEHLAFLRACSK